MLQVGDAWTAFWTRVASAQVGTPGSAATGIQKVQIKGPTHHSPEPILHETHKYLRLPYVSS